MNCFPKFIFFLFSIGYWRNALIVSIKSAIIDFKTESEQEKTDLYKAIETIILSQEFDITEQDLLSTLYMFDDVEQVDIHMKMKSELYSAPLSVKNLARATIRKYIETFDSEHVEKLKLSEELTKFLFFDS